MTEYNYLIPNEDKTLLAALRGETLDSIEGYRFDLVPSTEKTTFYSTARLCMDNGDMYDLQVRFVHIDITKDFWDDVGAYSFERANGGIWLPKGASTFKLPIHRTIDDVLLVNDYDALLHKGEKVGTFAFTKAVLLRTGLEYISLAMDDFCEDAIVVSRGFDPDGLVPDGSGSWYDEPGWTDRYSRKFEVA